MPDLADQLRRAGERVRKARGDLDRASGSLRAAILEAHSQGMRRADIARAAGVSREWVRRVVT